MIYTDYNTRITNELKRERNRMQKTSKVETVRQWHAEDDGCAEIAGSTIGAIYESIRYTVGYETAKNFLKNF